MLYPQSNKFRNIFTLNGLWDFSVVGDDYLANNPLTQKQIMPVPSSMNELVTEKYLRDYVGKVVYERYFSFPVDSEKYYRLRIGATSHKCKIYLNGEYIGQSLSGFYPIDLPLNNLQENNRLSVVIDNRLSFQTLPPGEIVNGKQVYNFDFYNYTGIHRDVVIYSTNKNYIEDIIIQTVVDGDYKKVVAKAVTNGKNLKYELFDRENNLVSYSTNGELYIDNPILWECKKAYLYTLKVSIDGDTYAEKFGIRKVSYDKNGLYLNDKKVYLKGFGKHDDSYILGKGTSSAVNVRDFELLKWIGANSIRTSHYPYSEEVMNLCDEYGIMVINEVPAVGMNRFEGQNFCEQRFNDQTNDLHKQLVKQLIERDKNHPCVVMLSVANEAQTCEIESHDYFKKVIDYTRTLSNLPIIIVENTTFDTKSYIGDLVDFIGLNRYYSWYDEHGQIDKIKRMLFDECSKWYDEYEKPIILTEFGADTLEGYHSLPSESFSEEYQTEVLQEYFDGLDKLCYVVGEHIWNFADFKTKQGIIRARGNRKGVFTRDRQPKSCAFAVKKRWEAKQDFTD